MTLALRDQKQFSFWPLVENEIWLNEDFKSYFSVAQSTILSEFLAVSNDYKSLMKEFESIMLKGILM